MWTSAETHRTSRYARRLVSCWSTSRTRRHRWHHTAEHCRGPAEHQRIATAVWGTIVRSWLCPARTHLSLCKTQHGRNVAGRSTWQWQQWRQQHHLGRLLEQLAPADKFDALSPNDPGQTIDMTDDDDTWQSERVQANHMHLYYYTSIVLTFTKTEK